MSRIKFKLESSIKKNSKLMNNSIQLSHDCNAHHYA